MSSLGQYGLRGPMIWRCRDRVFDLERRALVMGVINVTPDSFSDGGRYLDPKAALDRALEIAAAGADLVDLGAESTRPGSEAVPAGEQWRRLGPVLAALRDATQVCVSVDTTSAEVAERALEAGARVVNDVSALSDPHMGPLVARTGAGVVLMHMQGTPVTMQRDPSYGDACSEIKAWLAERVRAACASGIAEECITVDPGIGFGKTIEHNLELIARLDELAEIGRPILFGASRKSFLGRLLEVEVDQRLEASLAAAAVAVFQGAAIVRAHDVAATVRVARVAAALRAVRRSGLLIHSARRP